MVSGVASVRVSVVVLRTDVLLPGGFVWRQNLTEKKRPFSTPSTRIDHISVSHRAKQMSKKLSACAELPSEEAQRLLPVTDTVDTEGEEDE